FLSPRGIMVYGMYLDERTQAGVRFAIISLPEAPVLEVLSQGARELGLELDALQLERFERYYRLLATSGRRAGVTSITDYEEVQRRHFLESLAVAATLLQLGVLGGASPGSALDLGSGGGFPGLPMKILLPALEMTLLEASARKSAFLRETVDALGLEGAQVVTARAEEAAQQPAYRERFDLVVARAVAPLPALVELALPFLRVGGHLAAPKGSRASSEVKQASFALEALHGEVVGRWPLPLAGAAHSQTLVLVRKTAPTPERYPRRAGVPAKRPLLQRK
ncbi:MAG: 16S rRNA (guanine(527)-N(7))-methyltransferase RsmG, partial [Dehalococcoidia bacterium]|nr:16S rRNA (guanine(527)-N(7))-methyltransferase RsmG [Dehalococcoidia bacterium]